MLGAPQKVILESYTQPTVVIGAPPMHVDYIAPVPVTNVSPLVLNLSAVPAGFYSKYETQQSSEEKNENTGTTSWSRGLSGRVNSKLVVGDPAGNNITGELDGGIKEVREGIVGTETTTYTGKALTLSQKTGFSDQVWYTSSRLNFYVYPVIGERLCPGSWGDRERLP